MKNLAKAILSVMSEVKGIDKSMTVGTGNTSYKGVSDKEVKQIIGASMAKNGLSILPIGVDPRTEVNRWEEEKFCNGKAYMVQKQSVFTEVKTKYLLLHESGESVELSGYGHGTDSQDKGAGKATTYALKYTLLYTFLTPTGTIDDADATHSDDHPAPGKKVNEPTTDQKAANMLKKPDPAAANAPEPTTDEKVNTMLKKESQKTATHDKAASVGIKALIDKCEDQKALVEVWNENPYWHTSEEFCNLMSKKKSDLAFAKKSTTKTKKEAVA